MAFQKQETTAYVKAQSGKGVAATVAAADAIEITAESALVKPMGNQVERPVLRPGTRLGIKKLTVGQWGEGPLGAELHGSGTAGVAPEFGPLLKSLLGSEAIVADTSVTYSIDTDGDTTWLTVEQYEDGAKYLAVDARCRSWALNVTANEIITQLFGLKSLTCTPSDASDGLTPVWDGQTPMVATSLTFTVGGSSLNCKSVELNVENAKADSYFNDNGLSDLPADSTLTAAGSFRPEMTNISPFTSFFAGTLADLVLVATNGTDTCTITLSDIQYDRPETEEEEGDLLWNIPYTVTGGVTVAFT